MPKDWIDQEAKRQAARIEGATVRWTRLRPGLSWLSLGVRVEGLYVRQPAENQGDARLEARAREIFVSFRLLPLLARRVEISAARVGGESDVRRRGRARVDRPAPRFRRGRHSDARSSRRRIRSAPHLGTSG